MAATTGNGVSPSIEELVVSLHSIGAVKFGSFKLKSGITSPVYFDLRVTVSYPKILAQIGKELWNISKDVPTDVLCGVPYTALPFATAISIENDVPMVVRRKEAKDYGTKKMVEGVYEKGAKCLVIEDVVTSGASVLETSVSLREEGLTVTDAVVLLDREQGGPERIASGGVKLRSVLTVSSFIAVLEAKGKLDKPTADSVRKFVSEMQFKAKEDPAPAPAKAARMKYSERAALCKNELAGKLLSLMEAKQSNLSVAADVNTAAEVLQLADKVGPHVCVLKTHVDVLADFTMDFATQLAALAEKHNFLIFEDRKFADIGNTVAMQYGAGVYNIAEWSHITNAHTVPGPGIIDGLAQVGRPKGRGCLLLAEMSSAGTLAEGEYTKKTVAMAQARPDFVMGFISTHKLSEDPGMVHMTPGVQLESGSDALGQRYLTPEVVLGERGSDIIIVGRGVYKAADPAKAAIEYKKRGWDAYCMATQ